MIRQPNIKKRLYKKIPALDDDFHEYTIPDGKKITILGVGGSASITPDTSVLIWFDKDGGSEELLFSTHSEASQENLSLEYSGDGKKIRIEIINATASEDYLGGYWMGIESDV